MIFVVDGVVGSEEVCLGASGPTDTVTTAYAASVRAMVAEPRLARTTPDR
jgi:hypothetical protein